MRARRIVRNRRIALVACIIVTLFITFICFSNFAKAENSREVYTYYTSYEIQSGDTLWSIADQFMQVDYMNKGDYIDTIKKTNHMLDDDIHAGDYLVIEYYSYEVL